MLAQLKEKRRHTGGKVKGMLTSHLYRVSDMLHITFYRGISASATLDMRTLRVPLVKLVVHVYTQFQQCLLLLLQQSLASAVFTDLQSMPVLLDTTRMLPVH
jgi:hypothetical protein